MPMHGVEYDERILLQFLRDPCRGRPQLRTEDGGRSLSLAPPATLRAASGGQVPTAYSIANAGSLRTHHETRQRIRRESPIRLVAPSLSKNSSRGMATLREMPKKSLNWATSMVSPLRVASFARESSITSQCR